MRFNKLPICIFISCFLLSGLLVQGQNAFMKDYFRNHLFEFKKQGGKYGLALKKSSLLDKLNDYVKANWYNKDTSFPAGTKWVVEPRYDSFDRLKNVPYIVGYRGADEDLFSFLGELLVEEITNMVPQPIKNGNQLYITMSRNSAGWIFNGVLSRDRIGYKSSFALDAVQMLESKGYVYMLGTKHNAVALFSLDGKQLTAFAEACDASMLGDHLRLYSCTGKQGMANISYRDTWEKNYIPARFDSVYVKEQEVVAETKDSTYYYGYGLQARRQSGKVASVEEAKAKAEAIAKAKAYAARLQVFKTATGFGLKTGDNKTVVYPVMDTLYINIPAKEAFPAISYVLKGEKRGIENIFHDTPDSLSEYTWVCFTCFGHGFQSREVKQKVKDGQSFKTVWDTRYTDGTIIRTTETGRTADVYRAGTVTEACSACKGLGSAKKKVVWDAQSNTYKLETTKIVRKPY